MGLHNQRRVVEASQPKYLGVVSEKLMASPHQTSKARYSSLSRTSMDSHLSDVVEENPLLHLNERPNAPHQEGCHDKKITFPLNWIALILQAIAFITAFATLVIEGSRLQMGYKNWHYQNTPRQLIAPAIAFFSFDILVHLLVALYSILSHYLRFTITSKHSSIHPHRTQTTPKSPYWLATVACLVEIFIIICLIVGLWIDLASTKGIPLLWLAQLCGWMTVALQIASIIKFARPNRTVMTLTLSFSPVEAAQDYQDVEDCGRHEPQSKSAAQEQPKSMI